MIRKEEEMKCGIDDSIVAAWRELAGWPRATILQQDHVRTFHASYQEGLLHISKPPKWERRKYVKSGAELNSAVEKPQGSNHNYLLS